MRYRVEFAATALEEIEEAFLWLNERSPSAAERWRRLLVESVNSLERLPERCGLAPEAHIFRREIRQLLYGRRNGKYRILFEIHGKAVIVVHIRHAARRPLGEEPLA